MEPENINQDVEQTNQVMQKSKLHQVTPLSKYLAMALFITLPFVGGWVGYQYAPEKVVEVEREVVKEITITEEKVSADEYPDVRYGSFSAADPDAYSIKNFTFTPGQNRAEVPSEHLVPEIVRKVSEDRVILRVDDARAIELGQGVRSGYATVIYDTVANKIIKQIDYPWFSVEEWFGLGIQVAIERDEQGRDIIMLRDYTNDREDVLYVEDEEGVVLYDVCEIGCKASLYITTDASVIISRHKTIEKTSATQLIEVLTIQIPDEYLNDNQRMYRDGLFEF